MKITQIACLALPLACFCLLVLLTSSNAKLNASNASDVYIGWDEERDALDTTVEPNFPKGWSTHERTLLNPGAGRYILAMSNQWYNSLVVLQVKEGGMLKRLEEVYTGGHGQPLVFDANNTNGGRNVAPLNSQSAVTIKAKNVFAVNAGDHTVSWLQFDAKNNLKLVTMARVAGVIPCSVAAHPELPMIAVLSCGGSGRVTVFKYQSGKLHKLNSFLGNSGACNLGLVNGDLNEPHLLGGPNSTRQFRRGIAPSEIMFSTSGDALYVMIKSKGLNVYPIYGGRLQQPANLGLDVDKSPEPFTTPFAFTTLPSQCRERGSCVVFIVKTFDNGITAAMGGGGSVEAYRIVIEHGKNVMFEKVSDLQLGSNSKASCWIAYANGFVCVANAASATVTCLKNGRTPMSLAEAGTAAVGVDRVAALETLMSPEGKYVWVLTPQPYKAGVESTPYIATLSLDANGNLASVGAESLGDLQYPTAADGAALYIGDAS